MKNYINRTLFDNPILYSNSVIGLLLITVGIILLFNPININLKVSASMILLGLFVIMILDVNEKSLRKTINGKQLTFISTFWIFLVFIISYNIDAEIFLIIVILGILVLKELISDYMSNPLKKRMTVIFYLLIITFIILVGQKVINIIGI